MNKNTSFFSALPAFLLAAIFPTTVAPQIIAETTLFGSRADSPQSGSAAASAQNLAAALAGIIAADGVTWEAGNVTYAFRADGSFYEAWHEKIKTGKWQAESAKTFTITDNDNGKTSTFKLSDDGLTLTRNYIHVWRKKLRGQLVKLQTELPENSTSSGSATTQNNNTDSILSEDGVYWIDDYGWKWKFYRNGNFTEFDPSHEPRTKTGTWSRRRNSTSIITITIKSPSREFWNCNLLENEKVLDRGGRKWRKQFEAPEGNTGIQKSQNEENDKSYDSNTALAAEYKSLNKKYDADFQAGLSARIADYVKRFEAMAEKIGSDDLKISQTVKDAIEGVKNGEPLDMISPPTEEEKRAARTSSVPAKVLLYRKESLMQIKTQYETDSKRVAQSMLGKYRDSYRALLNKAAIAKELELASEIKEKIDVLDGKVPPVVGTWEWKERLGRKVIYIICADGTLIDIEHSFIGRETGRTTRRWKLIGAKTIVFPHDGSKAELSPDGKFLYRNGEKDNEANLKRISTGTTMKSPRPSASGGVNDYGRRPNRRC
jgi:hypothetical protein